MHLDEVKRDTESPSKEQSHDQSESGQVHYKRDRQLANSSAGEEVGARDLQFL